MRKSVRKEQRQRRRLRGVEGSWAPVWFTANAVAIPVKMRSVARLSVMDRRCASRTRFGAVAPGSARSRTPRLLRSRTLRTAMAVIVASLAFGVAAFGVEAPRMRSNRRRHWRHKHGEDEQASHGLYVPQPRLRLCQPTKARC